MERPLIATLSGAAVVATVTAAVLVVSASTAPPAAAEGLAPYPSCDALLTHYRADLVKSATPYSIGSSGWGIAFAEGGAMAGTPAAAPATRSGADSSVGAVGTGATGTNTQEQGVDEPDLAKLRDGLLVTVVDDTLRVVRAGAQPELVSTLDLVKGEQGGYGSELLLAGDRALVVVPGWRAPEKGSGDGGDAARSSFYGGEPLTRVVLVDLADAAAPRVLERMELDGSSLTSRLVGDRVRLVTRSSPVVQPAQPIRSGQEQATLRENRRRASQVTLGDVLPRRVRTDAGGRVLSDSRAVECGEVARAEEPRGASTLLVTTLDPARGLAPVDSTAVTTDGDLVYASAERLYVATSRWGTVAPAASEPSASVPSQEQVTTELHAFDTTSDETRYVGTGSVPGYVLGRWALSEHEGRLRVAVTSAPPWGSATESVSSLHVLEETPEALAVVGKVSGMGKGERIQAVRYFGDLAAVVTFRQVDPLYLLDLSDPVDPRVTGELKVPGFSAYLHPVGDDLLLGVGMDADEKTGQTTGVQLSTFDVSDRARPRQVDRLSLGAGWTPVLSESRAFGFDVARRTAVLPLQTWDGRSGAAFALGVRVGADGSLAEAGRLEVMPESGVERVLHDADHVYAVNRTGVAAGDAGSMARTGNLSWR
jgi:uncharacterized secreted protein with C-terminal beta-propeller domain